MCLHMQPPGGRGSKKKKEASKKQFWLLPYVIHYSTAERRYEGTAEGVNKK